MATAKPNATDIFGKLKAPFAADAISWRIGSTNKDKTKGMALAYIDARDVQDRLDEAVGPGNWADAYTETARGRVICSLSIKVDGEWVTKSDGAGDTGTEAEKGAISDAFKRAAVKWGVGRYLYALPSPWVEMEAFGKSFKIAANQVAKLEAVAAKPVAQWAKALREIDSGEGDAAPAKKEAPAAKQESDEERVVRLKAFAVKARDAIQATGTLEALDDVCAKIKASPTFAELKPDCQATIDKLAEFEADQRAALASKEEAEADVKTAEPPKEGPKKKAAPAQTAPTSNGAKKRVIPLPDDRDDDSRKAWGQKLVAAIKASSSRAEALSQVEANEESLAILAKESGSDSKALVLALIDKRFPAPKEEEAPQTEGAQKKAFPSSIVIDEPKPQTPAKWEQYAGQVLALIKAYAETDAQVEEIIAANKDAIDKASAALKTAVDVKLRGYAEAHFKAQANAR